MNWMTFTRNGDPDLQAQIKRAVTAYYGERQRLPLAIYVNPSEAAQARQALDALELKLPVGEDIGGVLAGEVWLQVED